MPLVMQSHCAIGTTTAPLLGGMGVSTAGGGAVSAANVLSRRRVSKQPVDDAPAHFPCAWCSAMTAHSGNVPVSVLTNATSVAVLVLSAGLVVC